MRMRHANLDLNSLQALGLLFFAWGASMWGKKLTAFPQKRTFTVTHSKTDTLLPEHPTTRHPKRQKGTLGEEMHVKALT